MERFSSLIGLLVFMGIAYAFSTDRKAIRARTVLWGVALQFLLALFVLKTNLGQLVFSWLGAQVTRILDLSSVGSEFVFGGLGAKGAGPPGIGFVLAFRVLPTIIFVAATFAVLYHLGIMQVIVALVARVMSRLMG